MSISPDAIIKITNLLLWAHELYNKLLQRTGQATNLKLARKRLKEVKNV